MDKRRHWNSDSQNMATPITAIDALDVTKKLLMVSHVVSGVGQLVRAPSFALAVTLMLSGLGVALLVLQFDRRKLVYAPLSTLVLIGYGISYFYLPVIGKAIDGAVITDGLNHPEGVMCLAFGSYIPLIGAHWAAINSRFGTNVSNRLALEFLRPAGLLRAPTESQLWIFGTVGLLGMALTVFSGSPGESQAETGPLTKVIKGLNPFAYAPFLLLAPRLFGLKKWMTTKRLLQLTSYGICLLVVGMGRNSRSAILLGLASAGVAIALSFWVKLVSLTPSRVWKGITTLLLTLVLMLQMQDLATAMVIVRGQRDDVGRWELLQKTWEMFQDKRAIREWETRELADFGWSEEYMENLFLNRICNLSYTDMALGSAMRLSDSDLNKVARCELSKVVALLPSPVIRFLRLPVNKEEVLSYSMGDYIYYLDSGDSYALGGFRTGSLLVSAYAIFGWGFPVGLGLVSFVSFILLNSLSFCVTRNGVTFPRISAAGLMVLFSTMFWLTSAALGAEGFASMVGFPLRGFWQTLVLYGAMFWISRALISNFKRDEREKDRPSSKA